MFSPVPVVPRQDLFRLLSAFVERATQQPQSDSLTLFIGDQRCGWLFPAAADALASTPGIVLTRDQAHFGQGLSAGAELDGILAELALRLKAAGCTPGWRNELLDVLTDTPNVGDTPKRMGAIERGVMRPLGLTTRAVHLSGWSEDGQLWVARRALSKATDPGMWDTLVGGLVGNLEDPELALLRESDEEAGLDAPDLIARTPLRTIAHMRRRLPEGFQTEAVMTCECVLPRHVQPANRDGEVMDIQCFDTASVYKMLKEDAFTLEASIVITEDLWQRSVA